MVHEGKDEEDEEWGKSIGRCIAFPQVVRMPPIWIGWIY